MLGAAIIHPDVRAVIPLMPEPIVQQDGTSKNDCERTAAKRFIAKLRHDYPHLKFIITEDSLSSNAPHIATLTAHQLHYILGVKAGDHAYLFEQVQAAEKGGRVTSYERHDRAAGDEPSDELDAVDLSLAPAGSHLDTLAFLAPAIFAQRSRDETVWNACQKQFLCRRA